MRFLFNMSHPAHVHLYRNAIKELELRGHICKVTVVEKEMALRLLDRYDIEYDLIGRSVDNLVKKGIELLKIDWRLLRIAKHFEPDVLVGGVGNAYVAHVGKIIGRPSVVFDDTEHAKLQHILTDPFVTHILTPSCYRIDLGSKQIRYNGYHELSYLHPNHFQPDPSRLQDLGIDLENPIIVLRFVSWTASHDIGERGLNLETKLTAVREFSRFGKVYITSEKPLDEELEEYRVTIPPEQIHNLLYYASLLYGESATMASEGAVLGTHSIYCDFIGRGYTDEQETSYGLVFNYRLDDESQNESIKKGIEMLNDQYLIFKGREKATKLLAEKIDVTEFMVDFLERFKIPER